MIEIKTIPAASLLAATARGNYFEKKNSLFSPLFRYIQTNDIAMTTPVEVDIEPAAMYFYVSSDYDGPKLQSTEKVQVIALPARTVASIGVRGSYSAKNLAKAQAELQAWLAQQDDWQADGFARAIYWNGPFTFGMFKRSEVHIPVKASK
jgi:DNA gyrase inhibitor GyrI